MAIDSSWWMRHWRHPFGASVFQPLHAHTLERGEKTMQLEYGGIVFSLNEWSLVNSIGTEFTNPPTSPLVNPQVSPADLVCQAAVGSLQGGLQQTSEKEPCTQSEAAETIWEVVETVFLIFLSIHVLCSRVLPGLSVAILWLWNVWTMAWKNAKTLKKVPTTDQCEQQQNEQIGTRLSDCSFF